MSWLYNRVRGTHADEIHGIKRWKLDGTSRCYRIVCAALIPLPKLLVDMLLAYLGGLYVVSTQDPSDMLLKTLSLVFIVELDDMMYRVFTSDAMRHHLENMQSVKIALTNRWRVMTWLLASFLAPIFVVGLTFHLSVSMSFCKREEWTWTEAFKSCFDPFSFADASWDEKPAWNPAPHSAPNFWEQWLRSM